MGATPKKQEKQISVGAFNQPKCNSHKKAEFVRNRSCQWNLSESITSYRPAQVLKGKPGPGTAGHKTRNFLVVFQFVISISMAFTINPIG